MKKYKNISLGECPYCNSVNYTRVDNEWVDDFVNVSCNCNDCNKDFTEYFQLDEVKFDCKEDDICLGNTLGYSEKEILLKAMNLLIETEGDTKDYTGILTILKGGLIRQD